MAVSSKDTKFDLSGDRNPATFSGVKSLDPLGNKQPAPATFRYT